MGASWELHNADCMDVMGTLPDESVDLAVLDPPYYRIILRDWEGNKLDWDAQWETMDDYKGWLSGVLAEVDRVMKDTGSLYLFCDDLNAAHVQLVAEEHFRPLNSIVWHKPDVLLNKSWRTLRRYVPSTERIVFAEKKGTAGLHLTGWQQIHNDPQCFAEVKALLRDGKARAMEDMGLDERGFKLWFSELTGTARMDYHYFGDYQFAIPTERIWAKMTSSGYWGGDVRSAYDDMRGTYDQLRDSYEELRSSYDDARRPFFMPGPVSDVWTMNTTRGERFHPTQKPLELMRRILEISTRPNTCATVLDPFAGSAAMGVECIRAGHRYIGCEKDPEMHEKATGRLCGIEKAWGIQRRLDAWA